MEHDQRSALVHVGRVGFLEALHGQLVVVVELVQVALVVLQRPCEPVVLEALFEALVG